MSNPLDHAIRDVLRASRVWAKARDHCRKTADSKKATEAELTKAKAALMDSSHNLAKAVSAFEKALRTRPAKAKTPIDWNKVLSTMSSVAGSLASTAFASPSENESPAIKGRVIDTTGEEM